jgi:hypothetical protein
MCYSQAVEIQLKTESFQKPRALDDILVVIVFTFPYPLYLQQKFWAYHCQMKGLVYANADPKSTKPRLAGRVYSMLTGALQRTENLAKLTLI